MSNYSETSLSGAVISDESWVILRAGERSLGSSVVRVSDSAPVRILILAEDTLGATDESDMRLLLLAEDMLGVGEGSDGASTTAEVAYDTVRAGDRPFSRVGVVLDSEIVVSDDTHLHRRQTSLDTLAVHDGASGIKAAAALSADRVRVSDSFRTIFRVLAEDTLTVSDSARGSLRARTTALDTLTGTDEATGTLRATYAAVSTLRAVDMASGTMHAATTAHDEVFVDDESDGGREAGQAWTAGVDDWAMSRYAPFGLTWATAADGVLYVADASGVYALNSSDEHIEAEVVFGQQDLGGGRLSHPLAAYVEYELVGVAELEVGQTQLGSARQSWTYHLPYEPADVLTNGRFVLGKGLRGRHFDLILRLSGTRAYFNDLGLLLSDSPRRV